MSPETQIALYERLLRAGQGEPDGPAITEIHVSEYLDPARAERERALMRSRPVAVGHASNLEPGQIWPLEICGTPALLARDREGSFRAFLNACRHRGMRLAAAKTSCRSVSCPYHGWTYSLSGQLASLPGFEHFPALDRSESGLVPLPAAEQGELLWVGLKPGSPWLELPEIETAAHEFGPWLSEHRSAGQLRAQAACNWKLLMDALLEGYRPKGRGPLIASPSISDREPSYLRFVAARQGVEEGTLRDKATVAWLLLPSTLLLFHSSSASLLQIWPDGIGRCSITHERIAKGDADTKLLDEIDARIAEEIPLCEAIWAAMKANPAGVHTLSALDAHIHTFHEGISRALGR